MPKKLHAYIRDLETGEVVHETEWTGELSVRRLERFEIGMLMKMDAEKFYLDTKEIEDAVETATLARIHGGE